MGNLPESKKLLRDASAEYEKIANALLCLMRGESSAEEVNRISNECLNNVDNLINEYMHK
mgnify:CR=1 FL=1